MIAITKREEVAKIFGKPVYRVGDVALLPLSSKADADSAIRDALGSDGNVSDESDLGTSDDEGLEAQRQSHHEMSTTPANDIQPFSAKNNSSTSIAVDVATRNLPFGKFASQWLSRRKSSITEQPMESHKDALSEPNPASIDDHLPEEVATIRDLKEAHGSTPAAPLPKFVATRALLPRILRTTRMLFTSGSYFFAYEVDLTHSLSNLRSFGQTPRLADLDSLVSYIVCSSTNSDKE